MPAESEQDTAAALAGASAFVTFAGRYSALVAAAVERSGLSWIHLVTSGVDPLLRFPPPPGVLLSSGGRVWSAAVAEHALALLLGLRHNLHLAERHRATGTWSRRQMIDSLRVVRNTALLLIGFGDIGRRIARLLAPFDVRLTAVARGARRQDGVPVHPASKLPDLLPAADAVIVAVPLGPDTSALLGAAELGAMRSGAVLVDVSRGGVVDPDALLQALRHGPLSGAGLDVFATEPLAHDHPLWGLPNVILTPHIAGFGDDLALQEMAGTFRANLEDFLAGRPLRDGLTL